jgi:hypothetical protein
MSKKSAANLTLPQILAQFLSEVQALNNNLQSLPKMVELLTKIEQSYDDFFKYVENKGIVTKSR